MLCRRACGVRSTPVKPRWHITRLLHSQAHTSMACICATRPWLGTIGKSASKQASANDIYFIRIMNFRREKLIIRPQCFIICKTNMSKLTTVKLHACSGSQAFCYLFIFGGQIVGFICVLGFFFSFFFVTPSAHLSDFLSSASSCYPIPERGKENYVLPRVRPFIELLNLIFIPQFSLAPHFMPRFSSIADL